MQLHKPRGCRCSCCCCCCCQPRASPPAKMCGKALFCTSVRVCRLWAASEAFSALHSMPCLLLLALLLLLLLLSAVPTSFCSAAPGSEPRVSALSAAADAAEAAEGDAFGPRCSLQNLWGRSVAAAAAVLLLFSAAAAASDAFAFSTAATEWRFLFAAKGFLAPCTDGWRYTWAFCCGCF